MSENLTPEQVDNWRKALAERLGPYAFIMPVSQIEAIRDKMQRSVGQQFGLTIDAAPSFCTCDPVKNGTTKHLNGDVTCNKCRKLRK